MEDSMVTSDEVIKSYDKEVKPIPTNFNENKVTCVFINHIYMIDRC